MEFLVQLPGDVLGRKSIEGSIDNIIKDLEQLAESTYCQFSPEMTVRQLKKMAVGETNLIAVLGPVPFSVGGGLDHLMVSAVRTA